MGSRKIVIHGRLEGMNEYIAAMNADRHKGNKLKRKRTEQVAWNCRSQLRGWKPRTKVRLEYVYYEPNRRRDKDNVAGFAHKVVQDGLVLARTLKNDGWDDVDSFADEFRVDEDHPRIEVTIRECGKEDGEAPDQTVLAFISQFTLGGTREPVIECFTSGCCWWFAEILRQRFCGALVYDEIDGHFGCEIGKRVYDITGDCTGTFRKTYWSVFEAREPNLSVRILKRCRDLEEDEK